MKKQNNIIVRWLLMWIIAMVLCGFSPSESFAQAGSEIKCPQPASSSGQTSLEKQAAESVNSKIPKIPNPYKVQCETAIEMMQSALALVTGSEQGFYNIYDLVNTLANDQSADYKGKFQEGLKLSDARKWVKDKIASDKEPFVRKAIINRAAQEVYGRDALAFELLFYDEALKTKDATYTSIVSDAKQNLNKKPAERKLMLNRVYQKTMGREASEEELKYWQPRSETFAQIVAANRDYLYSSGGEKDLKETIGRVFTALKKPSPDENQLTKWVKAFAKSKMIYTQMIDQGLKDYVGLPL